MSDQQQQPQPSPRWLLSVVDNAGQVHVTVNALSPDVTTHEIAARLVQVAARYFSDSPRRVLTEAEKEENGRRDQVMRDYPASRYFPEAGVSLCEACADVYAHLLDGPGVVLPPKFGVVPCDYHLDESKRPMPYEDALKSATAAGALEDTGEPIEVGSKANDDGVC